MSRREAWRIRAAKALRGAAQQLDDAQGARARLARDQAERRRHEEELIRELGVACVHDVGGYCDGVVRGGGRGPRVRCPLSENRSACCRPRRWSK